MARSNNDFLGALAVGTLLGVATALAMRPSPRSARDRLLRELGPYRRQLHASAEEARRAMAARAGSAGPLPDEEDDGAAEAIEMGRELLAEFREEVRRVLDEARAELASLGADSGAARRARRELEERLGRRLGRRYGDEEPPEGAPDDEEP